MTLRVQSIAIAMAALAVSLAAPTAAQEDEKADNTNLTSETVAVANGRWIADFGEDNCTLARRFQSGDDPYLLAIEQWKPGSDFDLRVAGPSFSRFSVETPSTLRFNDKLYLEGLQTGKAPMEKYGTMVAFSNVSLTKEAREFVSPPETDGSSRLAAVVPTPPPPIEDQRALNVETGKTITAFALGQGDQKIVLQTGDLGQAFKVLNQCTADLVRSWGFDFDQALTRKPNLINPAKVARRVVDNYPTAALRNEEQGEVRLRLIIEANGKVSDCIAVMNNPSEVLQKGACKQMRRAKFKPALDEKAQPVRHYYLTELTYQLY